MSITLNQHRNTITKRIISTFSDSAPVQMGLSAFFEDVTTQDKEVAIEVERNYQKIAVDVARCTDPVLNTFSKSTEKIFMPPLYNEAFDFTACQRYDVTFGRANNPTLSDAAIMIKETDRYLRMLEAKIDRAAELQRAQVLQTGIVVLKNGDNIDYKRQTASIKDLTGDALWSASTTATPLDDIALGGTFIREQGLSTGNMLNVIMGQGAFNAFMATDQVQDEANFRRIDRINLGMPEMDEVSGMVFHGQFASQDFVVNLWTYNAFYTDANNDQVKYIETGNAIILPNDFVGKTAYAGVPAIVRDTQNAEFPEYIGTVEAKKYINNYIDPKAKAHMFEVLSAPVAIPVSVDRIYTIETL